MKIFSTLLVIVTVGLLSACASAPAMRPAESFEGRSEKAMLAVLRNVEATDEQRARILDTFDRHNPNLVKLANEWEDITLQWDRLNRADAAFLTQAAALSDKRMSIARQQLIEGAQFEQDVATTLTPEQWTEWTQLWTLVGEGANSCGPRGGPGGRRR